MTLRRAAVRRVVGFVLLAAALSGPIQAGDAPVPDARADAGRKPNLAIQLGHSGGIAALAFSRDGSLVATASDDHTVRLWVTPAAGTRVPAARFESWSALRAAQELRGFIGHSGAVRCVAFSPKADRLATGGDDGTVRLWSVATGEPLWKVEPYHEVTAVAFSPDGRWIVTAGTLDDTGQDGPVQLRDATSGELVRALETVGRAAAFSADGTLLAVAGSSGSVSLWGTRRFALSKRLQGLRTPVHRLSFSRDGHRLLAVSPCGYKRQEGTAVVWALPAGTELRRLGEEFLSTAELAPDGSLVALIGAGLRVVPVRKTGTEEPKGQSYCGGSEESAAFAPDGRRLLIGCSEGLAELLDLGSEPDGGYPVLVGHAASVTAIAVSPDGSRIAAGSEGRLVPDRGVRLWDASAGGASILLAEEEGGTVGLGFLDGTRLAVALGSGPAKVLDTTSGEMLLSLVGNEANVRSLSVSRDGRRLATGTGRHQFEVEGPEDFTARVWDAETGVLVRSFPGHPGAVSTVALSAQGDLLLTGSESGPAFRLFRCDSGKAVRDFGLGRAPGFESGMQEACAAALSPDGTTALLAATGPFGGGERMAGLFDVARAKERSRLLTAGGNVRAAKFSASGTVLLTGGDDGTARLWRVSDGTEQMAFRHAAEVSSVDWLADERVVVTGGTDGAVTLWDRGSGRALCRLISLRDGNWVVVDPEGRFDSGQLDGIRGLSWVMPDDPFRPLPIEVFMRDYYEPRLLPRLLAGSKLPPVRALEDLNRAQPEVRIASVTREGESADTVSVAVEVRRGRLEVGSARAVMETSAYDLRLFRDGQVVGVAPRGGGEVRTDQATGMATVTFTGVRLPRKADVRDVELSAYAFNVDRVKSPTARLRYPIPADLTPRKGRAYLVSMGVNVFEDPAWNLTWAARDATLLQASVGAALARTGAFEEVVSILLTSESGETPATARKGVLRDVLTILSGGSLSVAERAALVRELPGASRLQRALPEDFVLVTVSTHGYLDGTGGFHLFPADVPQEQLRGVRLATPAGAISTDELAEWLRGVDAGDLALVVDACHSAATVEAEGFKPGPMGSRGLGQLAYDKGMRILAASQAADVAVESDRLEQGLLTYALVREGLGLAKADAKPRDGRILVEEWFGYAADRVPGLQAELFRGAVGLSLAGEISRGAIPEGDRREEARQKPALFDFGRRRTATVVWSRDVAAR